MSAVHPVHQGGRQFVRGVTIDDVTIDDVTIDDVTEVREGAGGVERERERERERENEGGGGKERQRQREREREETRMRERAQVSKGTVFVRKKKSNQKAWQGVGGASAQAVCGVGSRA